MKVIHKNVARHTQQSDLLKENNQQIKHRERKAVWKRIAEQKCGQISLARLMS